MTRKSKIKDQLLSRQDIYELLDNSENMSEEQFDYIYEHHLDIYDDYYALENALHGYVNKISMNINVSSKVANELSQVSVSDERESVSFWQDVKAFFASLTDVRSYCMKSMTAGVMSVCFLALSLVALNVIDLDFKANSLNANLVADASNFDESKLDKFYMMYGSYNQGGLSHQMSAYQELLY